MALKGFRKPQQDTQPTQALANAVKDFTLQLEKNPLLDGLLLKDLSIGTTDTDIVHGLGRPYVGWFVVRRTSAADIYEGTQTNTSQYLTLIASSAATVSIYVF